ncbi:hypothetical protein AX769_16940 [Frondihabitans sp. PAMC 28766]|uniref:IclR family transcriptional regulator n=1 Tax=Frondihabitans sp. PAMC 28766 TaxID=1795630 RepID=UPI00078DB013|nr:IclR family transcriptional regulator [Frondihabitans sp. PAMC 28766]AMM21518.1 hypothetical protein AX769_16940 [Frondihabitans sp. PAMC 28766]
MSEPQAPTDGMARSGVVDRAFSVLSAFDERHLALSLTAITRRTGLPINSALRIIRSLVDVGALERRDDGLYVVGLRLFEIAALGPRSQGLRRIAMPFLQDLHAVTDEHVLFTVREDDEAVLIERLSARGAGPVSYRIGGRLPLSGTGAGLVLLAHAPSELQDAMIARIGTSTAVSAQVAFTSGDELRHRLAAIRLEGSLMVATSTADGMGTVAAPVFAQQREAVAAVSVVAPADERVLGALVPAVRLSARAISAALAPRRTTR